MKRSVALLETYKLHAELAERAAALREEFTKLYTGAVSAIVAAGVLLQRFASDKTTELEWVLPVLGAAVSLSWLLSFWSTTARLGAKFRTLVDLEQKLPFAFLEQEASYSNPLLHRKITGALMPALFLLVCLAWLCAVTH